MSKILDKKLGKNLLVISHAFEDIKFALAFLQSDCGLQSGILHLHNNFTRADYIIGNGTHPQGFWPIRLQ